MRFSAPLYLFDHKDSSLKVVPLGSDLVMEIACGLYNLRVSIRHPLPTFDLLSFVSNA